MARLYVPGRQASGTLADFEAMAQAAYPGWVFVLRRGGARLPARKVEEPVQGSVLCIDRYGEQDRFYVRLYRPGQFTNYGHDLHGARVVRESGGCMTITGDEFVEAERRHQRQTWLCVPTAERGWAILRKMAATEGDGAE